ncbi:MAG: hypothetical protein EHM48_05630 [Planctomycetaceae bacterium]|nr:MAG: hypothetical protein EHM48_05630 [Planctomycetaceae bacterium]
MNDLAAIGYIFVRDRIFRRHERLLTLTMKSDKPQHPQRRDNGRHFWREISHRESHSQTEEQAAGPVHAHPLASAAPPIIVTTDAAMAEMVSHLKHAGSFAFDSEFIGERSYEPQLCLLQTATRESVFIVDPLASMDLLPLWELIVSPKVEKIVLAGQQDFGPAVQRTNKPPANIMDLQIAAGFIHTDYPLSLVKLIAEFVGVSLGKGLTFTHLDNCPLSPVQLRYAADDVRYLPAAREAIGKRLAESGRVAWAREECAASLEDISLYQPAPETLYLRVRGRDRLGRQPLAILRELAMVRDRAAASENVPPRTLLKDEILLSMARHPIGKLEDLDRVSGLPRNVEAKYGHDFLDATVQAMALPENRWPARDASVRPATQDHIDKIYADINKVCIEQSIAPALVASRKDVARASRVIGGGKTPQPVRLLQGWRKELLNDLLKKLA